jgi:hypothetical protein
LTIRPKSYNSRQTVITESAYCFLITKAAGSTGRSRMAAIAPIFIMVLILIVIFRLAKRSAYRQK